MIPVRSRRLAPVLLAAVCLLTVAPAAAHASTAAKPHQGGPLPAGPTIYYTCQPQGTFRIGLLRADNDAPFAGLPGKSCITFTGSTLTVDRNLPSSPGGVVTGYPNIRYGPKYGSFDPGAVLPARVTNLHNLTLHVTASGNAPGHSLTDVDAWIYPGTNTRMHGTAEIVIGVEWKGWHAGTERVRIGHRWYLTATWITGTGRGWPLTVFRPLHRRHHVSLRIGAFVHWMLEHHELARGEYLGNVAFGSEIWDGGAGLSDGMTTSP